MKTYTLTTMKNGWHEDLVLNDFSCEYDNLNDLTKDLKEHKDVVDQHLEEGFEIVIKKS